MACSSMASISCLAASGALGSMFRVRASIRPAVRKAIDSPTKVWVAMSPIFLRMRSNSAMGLPNCLRSVAYLIPSSRQYLDPPTPPTPSFQRPMFRMLKAILWPWPIVPSTLSAGTTQSSRIRGQVLLPRMPSLCSSGPDGQARAVAVDQEAGELGLDLTVRRLHLGEHREQVGEGGVGDELLGAGQR